MVSDSSSLRSTVSPSPSPTPQIPSKEVDYRNDPISPEDRESAGADESQDARPHTSSSEMLQHPPPDADDNHSESDLVSPENRDWIARMDDGPSETLHVSLRAILQDHPSHADHDSSGSCIDLQDTLSSGNASRVDVNHKLISELSIHKLVFAVAKIGVGLDYSCGSDESDEEGYLSETQQDDSEASGTLFVSTLPTRTLHERGFNSGCR